MVEPLRNVCANCLNYGVMQAISSDSATAYNLQQKRSLQLTSNSITAEAISMSSRLLNL